MKHRPWLVRCFDVATIDPRGRAVAAGKRIKVEDRFFPLATRTLAPGIDLARVRGHLGLHTDRAQDQSYSSYYPWHEGMIWNLVLGVIGRPAALLRRANRDPRLIPLEPGVALWLDITEVQHGITSLHDEHPNRHPEVVMVQVLGTPSFMLDAAAGEAATAVRESLGPPEEPCP